MFWYIYISLCGRIWHSEISLTLWKSTFGIIDSCLKSDRVSKFGCVFFVVMNNILKVGLWYLGACAQLCPDVIRILALLSSGSSIIIQMFWGNAVNFEVFSKRVIPIEGRVWVFSYKGVRWFNCNESLPTQGNRCRMEKFPLFWGKETYNGWMATNSPNRHTQYCRR